MQHLFSWGKKVIVQRNKEVKLYILNQTEKHLKHQHKLTIAALLHASLKTGKTKEQCFSPSAMHMLSTPIFPRYSWRFSLTLGNCSMIIWKILAKTFYLHQCTLSAQYILLLTVRGNKSHVWGELPHLLLWLMTAWGDWWVEDGKRHKTVFFFNQVEFLQVRKCICRLCITAY